jgi:hypothetical protein
MIRSAEAQADAWDEQADYLENVLPDLQRLAVLTYELESRGSAQGAASFLESSVPGGTAAQVLFWDDAEFGAVDGRALRVIDLSEQVRGAARRHTQGLLDVQERNQGVALAAQAREDRELALVLREESRNLRTAAAIARSQGALSPLAGTLIRGPVLPRLPGTSSLGGRMGPPDARLQRPPPRANDRRY